MIIQAIGWAGTTLLLLGFYLLSKGKMQGRSYNYQLTQFFGAVGIGISAFAQHAWPAFAVEFVWAIIAGATLISLGRRGPSKRF
ncbi:MAG: hypothetical protein UW02_C0015G0002 [Candidatus Nomurabacteria bacterium GW2011_GWB1_43_7]|uniref:CBU-0592-like domain-containing protein n=1 Tax=Candidatus Nomurabacteria bacterium GW2011_GWB1_43_7 TaxID=1618747 RepID=A0A0G1FAI8_9BACT|nr:MAG: hypothetical protein UW02_C0015G0002 [Candidatus Nomurabacteria bacterium GW2011_GWB1_43_7]